jgi:hypothetical protein
LIKTGSSLRLDRLTYEIDVHVRFVSLARILILPKDRCIGWVPENAIPGDAITVLTGARIPIVLRPREDGYTVVGDAYVQGIMDGEAMTDDTELEYLTLA